jgi:hypothetical protein
VAAGVALAGCGGDDSVDSAGDSTATPAWDSTPADPGAAPTEPGESPAAAEAPEEAPAADAGQPAADGGDAAGDQAGGDASGAAADGGDASGAAAGTDGGTGGTGGDGGTEDPPAGDPIAQPIDACTLAVDAIAGVLGAGPTPEDTSDPAEFGPACAWTGASGHELILSVSGYDDWVGIDSLLGSDAQEIDDLGSEAWASLGSPSNVQVAWRRDDVSVAVAASLDSGGEAVLDVARAIDAALLAAGY